MGDEYPMEKVSIGRDVSPTLTESLKSERKALQQKLGQLDETIALIEANPEIQKTLDALSQLGKLRNY